MPDALQALGTRLTRQGGAVPTDLLMGGLHIANSCMRLAPVLPAPRNAALRMVQASAHFASVVGGIIFNNTRLRAFTPTATTALAARENRYVIAVEVLRLMRSMTLVCRAPEASFEVLAAAVPPQRMLQLLHGAGAALLAALEAGALALPLLPRAVQACLIKPLLATVHAQMRARTETLSVPTLSLVEYLFTAGDALPREAADQREWMAACPRLIYVLGLMPDFQPHTAALAAAPDAQLTWVGLLLRYCLPPLLKDSSAAGAAPSPGVRWQPSGWNLAARVQTLHVVTAGVQAPFLTRGLHAELARPGGALVALRLAARAAAALPLQPIAGASAHEAKQWSLALQSSAGLVSYISGLMANHDHHYGSGRGDLQTAAWEVMAAVPLLAMLVPDSPAIAVGGQQRPSHGPGSFDHQRAVLFQMMVLVRAAEPLQLPSPKYVATWASAVEAMLRLLPALVEQGGEEALLLAAGMCQVLWSPGCDAVNSWAHSNVAGVSEHEAALTGEHAVVWAAAAAPLAAAHMRACRFVHWLRARPDGGTARLDKLLWAFGPKWRRVAQLLVHHHHFYHLAARASESLHRPVRWAADIWAVVSRA